MYIYFRLDIFKFSTDSVATVQSCNAPYRTKKKYMYKSKECQSHTKNYTTKTAHLMKNHNYLTKL